MMKINTKFLTPWRCSLKKTIFLLTMFLGLTFAWQAQAQDYCIPEAGTSVYYINNFSTTGGIDNVSNMNSGFSPTGYGDFTDMVLLQENTGEVSFSVDIEGDTSGFRIWIDWNQDGQFSADEVVYQSDSYESSHSGSFTVPEDVISGQTRMRIVSDWLSNTGDVDPCETGFAYGEFEDYTFEVIGLEDCEGPVTAGTIITESTVCAGVAFTLEVEGDSESAGGLTRQWKSSVDEGINWEDVEGATSSSYIISDGIDEETQFKYVVSCINDDSEDETEVITISLNPDNECYCIPENNSTISNYISNVSTDGAFQDIDNSTGFTENGYADYTDSQVIIAFPGQEFDYSISGSSVFDLHYSIWLDMDQNGDFDGPLENIANSDGASDAPFTGTFEVPSDLEEGTYRLRIRNTWSAIDFGPCQDNDFGETEDYTLQVVSLDCFSPVNITIDYITDTSAQVNWDANNENSWVVIYGESGFDPENEGDTIQVEGSPSTNISGLNDETTYDVYVKTLCDESESVWNGPITFTTKVTPPVNTHLCDAIPLEANAGCIDGPYTNVAAFEELDEPTGSCLNEFSGTNTVWFTFTASADGEAVITTDFDSTEMLTEIVVFEAPTDCEDLSTLGEQVGCANASSGGVIELEGLIPGEVYYVKVGGFNSEEGLFCIEVQMDGAPVCLAPSEITIGDITEDTVEVSWTAGGDETQWEVIYGEAGFDSDSEGESVVVNTTETTLIGLTPESDYDVYVRAICGENIYSDLTGPEVFTTEEMSVDNQIFNDFTFYPNPVKDQLTLKAGTQIENVEVYNLLGQNVISAKPNRLEAQINTETLQSGVYLMEVNINGSQKSFRMVKK